MKTTNMLNDVGQTIDQDALDTVTGGVGESSPFISPGDTRYQAPARQEPTFRLPGTFGNEPDRTGTQN